MPEQRSVEQQFEQYQHMVGCGIDSYPLLLWKQREAILPAVANSARRLLCVPASAGQLERDFPITGILTGRRHAKLSGRHINVILFLN